MQFTNTIKVFNEKHVYILNPSTFRCNQFKPLNISFELLYNTITLLTLSYCHCQLNNTYSIISDNKKLHNRHHK